MRQGTLFREGPRARKDDPQTSHDAAAEHVASGANERQRAGVLAAVRARPGSTSDELAADTGMDRHVPGRRLIELERAGLVRRGEARVSRVGGRRGITWWPVGGG